MPNLLNILKKIIPAFLVLLILSSCGGFKLPKPGDARKIPASGEERAKKIFKKDGEYLWDRSLEIEKQHTNLVRQIPCGKLHLM